MRKERNVPRNLTAIDHELEDLFLMSNLSPKRTGLPFVVWISPKGGARHDVRVKVSPGPKAKPGEFLTVTVRPTIEVLEGEIPPDQLRLLRKWIELNRETLVKFWDGDIEYTEEVLPLLKPIEEPRKDS
jgi:hypothetical protein